MVHSLLKQGANHANWCEDFSFHYDYEGYFAVSAVFDGCSSGRDSFFASTLFARLFESVCKVNIISGRESPKTLAKQILYAFVWKLKNSAEILDLKTKDLLSTIVLMIRDTRDHSAYIGVIGDGFLSINGQRHEIDQSNMPNYIAYHLDDIYNLKSFEEWYEGAVYHPRVAQNVVEFSVQTVRDVTISTDGILSYVLPPGTESDIKDPVAFLTEDTGFLGNPVMMERKVKILRNKGWHHGDDLGFVRVLIPNVQLNLDLD